MNTCEFIISISEHSFSLVNVDDNDNDDGDDDGNIWNERDDGGDGKVSCNI